MNVWRKCLISFVLYLLVFALLVAFGVIVANSAYTDSSQAFVYDCQIDSTLQVYDGDTISDCKIFITDVDSRKAGKVWPGLWVEHGKLYVITDIRIAGIEAPERRVSRKNRDGTVRSEMSRRNERFAADQSRAALMNLLLDNRLRFQVVNPKRGKYFGRIVADCVVNGVDVGDYLLKQGHVVTYDGGTKPELDWDKLDKGLVR